MNNIEVVFNQILMGEFAVHSDAAASMSPSEFADLHQSAVRPWGKPPIYEAVNVEGVDYLWLNGRYDGWDRPIGKGGGKCQRNGVGQ